MSSLVIRNIGIIVTGDMAGPIADGDTIVARDGIIAYVGPESGADTDGITKVIDAAGATVIPGLCDNHVHPVIGDFTPRQRQFDFIESSLHGGVTTMISAGEPHTPGRPTDRVGVKALTILAHKSFDNLRIAVESAETTMVAKTTVELDAHRARQNLRLIELLEELDDVQRVTANFDIPEDVFAEVAG